MGLLSSDYYANALKDTVAPTSSPSIAPEPTVMPTTPSEQDPSVVPSKIISSMAAPSPLARYVAATQKPLQSPGVPNVPAGDVIKTQPDISPEEQTARFGGPVGSQAYYDYKANHPVISFLGKQLLSTVGVNFPDEETWDKMSRTDQVAGVAAASVGALTKMVLGLPKAAATAVASVGLTAAQPVYDIATGKPFDAKSMETQPKVNVPFLGEVPTLYQSAADAQKAGMGPIASTIFSGSNFFLNSAAVLPVSEALANTFRPRGDLSKPGTIVNTAPIKGVIDGNTFTAKTPSLSEYYTLTKTDAKNFGGKPSNVQWKMTPASEGGAQLAIVKQIKGAKPGDFVKTSFGLKKVEQGDLGPEVKLYSLDVQSTPKTPAPTTAAGESEPIFVLPGPRKGLENRPITEDQMNNLFNIGKAKGLDPSTRDAVVKTITGKDTIGAMTEADYVKAATTLAKFGEKYGASDPTIGPVGFARSYLSPQRHVFDYVEDTFGIPLKTQVYDTMERAQQMTRVLKSNLQPEFMRVFQKIDEAGNVVVDYTKSKFIQERRLIDAYARGDTGAITNNKTLSPEVKANLMDMAGNLASWYDKNGEILGLGREAYLKEYGGPKIAQLGGTFPQYKNLEMTPSKEFFAKFKRVGSLDPYIDDPLAAGQIYIDQGAKALHYGPALETFDNLYKSIPSQYSHWAEQANSYVQEKLGRLGKVEQFVDSFVPTLNKKLGISLPPDASRQAINYGLSSLYSGFVGTPKAVFQQTFQLPLFVYSRLGTRYAADAIIKSFSKAERDRIAAGGWLNDISLPYGSELAKEFSPLGKVGNAFKTGTQMALKPMTAVDNDIRIKTFLQAEMQWNDALNSYNAGSIRWQDLESKLDFGSFSAADRNLMRQNLIGGNMDAAFRTYMREILDETNFPYRTGSGARVTYGLAGKLATGLLNYTIESTNVLARWAATGQWDKIIRFAGNAQVVNNALQQTFGLNFADTLFQKPYGVVSPAVSAVGDFYSMVNGFIQNNRKNMNDARDSLVRTLKAATPLGVERRNVADFWKSIDAGPDANGMYPIYDDAGKMISSGDFSDIFWGSLMGFPTVSKINERNLYNDINNRTQEITDTQNQLNQLMREGKYDEMEALMQKTGVVPSSNAFNSAFLPRVQRAFNNAPTQAKLEFAPRVFPSTARTTPQQ